jgi:hypothetical protein
VLYRAQIAQAVAVAVDLGALASHPVTDWPEVASAEL